MAPTVPTSSPNPLRRALVSGSEPPHRPGQGPTPRRTMRTEVHLSIDQRRAKSTHVAVRISTGQLPLSVVEFQHRESFCRASRSDDDPSLPNPQKYLGAVTTTGPSVRRMFRNPS